MVLPGHDAGLPVGPCWALGKPEAYASFVAVRGDGVYEHASGTIGSRLDAVKDGHCTGRVKTRGGA